MADDVERLLLRRDLAQVEVAVDDRLLAGGRLGHDRAVGREDRRARAARVAEAASMKSSAAPIASGSSKPSGSAPAVMLAPITQIEKQRPSKA